MGWFTRDYPQPALPKPVQRQTFATASSMTGPGINEAIAQMASTTATLALQVPAVLTARNRLVAAVTGMPLVCFNSANIVVTGNVVEKLDPSRIPGAVMSELVEDLFLHGYGHWAITSRRGGLPDTIKSIRAGDAAKYQDGVLRVGGVEYRSVIYFEGITPGLLKTSISSIKDAITVAQIATRGIDAPMPVGYFKPKDFEADLDPDLVTKLQSEWEAARKLRLWAYLPEGIDLTMVPSATQQNNGQMLGSARSEAVLELARATGLDPSVLGTAVTSRVYQNFQSMRLDELDFRVALYTRPIAQRLSMPDVTAAGQRVVFDTDAFLRTDTKTRYETYKIGVDGGWLTPDDVTAREQEFR